MLKMELLDLPYYEAINILENLDEYGNNEEDKQIIFSAIYKVKNMATINAVPKSALKETISWLFMRAIEDDGEQVPDEFNCLEKTNNLKDAICGATNFSCCKCMPCCESKKENNDENI